MLLALKVILESMLALHEEYGSVIPTELNVSFRIIWVSSDSCRHSESFQTNAGPELKGGYGSSPCKTAMRCFWGVGWVFLRDHLLAMKPVAIGYQTHHEVASTYENDQHGCFFPCVFLWGPLSNYQTRDCEPHLQAFQGALPGPEREFQECGEPGGSDSVDLADGWMTWFALFHCLWDK